MRIIHDMGEGAHKLGRIFAATVTVIVLGWVKVKYPEVTETQLAFIASPVLLYIQKKGRGYQTKPADPNPVTEEDFK